MKRQAFKSQYGRRGISVSTLCPTRAIDRRLGRTHVATPMGDVAEMVRDAATEGAGASDARWTPTLIREAVRYALWRHAENRAAYAFVMGGVR